MTYGTIPYHTIEFHITWNDFSRRLPPLRALGRKTRATRLPQQKFDPGGRNRACDRANRAHPGRMPRHIPPLLLQRYCSMASCGACPAFPTVAAQGQHLTTRGGEVCDYIKRSSTGCPGLLLGRFHNAVVGCFADSAYPSTLHAAKAPSCTCLATVRAPTDLLWEDVNCLVHGEMRFTIARSPLPVSLVCQHPVDSNMLVCPPNAWQRFVLDFARKHPSKTTRSTKQPLSLRASHHTFEGNREVLACPARALFAQAGLRCPFPEKMAPGSAETLQACSPPCHRTTCQQMGA